MNLRWSGARKRAADSRSGVLPTLRSRRLRVVATLGALALTATTLGGTALLTAQTADAAPGNPGTPSAPSTVYAEDFQNVPGTTPVQTLTQYTSASGQKYTANQAWLTYCNGLIASASQSTTDANSVAACANQSNGANGQANWNRAQQLSYALGLYTGGTAAAGNANYADSAYTANNPGAGLVEFQTASNIPFTASNRFITFSADVAAINCTVSAPQLQFQLLNDAGTATNVGTAVNACTSTQNLVIPAVGNAGATGAQVGTTNANNALLFTGSSIGLRMLNNNGSGSGNDHAFDNVKILDVTPQLDKSFSPALTRTGDASTLTFTVTNTSELGNKNGWSFNDNLPAGLTLANSTVGGTCNATTSAPAGGSSIAITNGQLADGQASCTITVQVTSTTAGSYQNCPTTNVTTVGLNQPSCATVEFADPSYTVAKTADKTTAKQGDKVTYTVTVKNTGTVAYTTAKPATFTDDLSEVTDDASYNGDATNGATVSGDTLSWSGALDPGQTKTITYSVTVNTPDTGDKVITNAVTPTGPGGECATDGGCTTTTNVQSYTITKSVDRDQVIPGQKVTYTVTVQNTGTVDYTTANPIAFTDDLSKVTDDATYNDDATNGATVDGNTLSWSGALATGDTTTITYSFTVNRPDTGDQELTNAVVPNDPTACAPGACTTTVPNGSYSVAKTASTQTVTAGGTVTYTVTVKNTGAVAFTTANPATFTDDLSKVTDDATYNDDATNGATVSGNTLSWAGPLDIGATQTITYSVTVNNPDTGDQRLTNAVTPGIGGDCTTAQDCTTTTLVRQFTVVKTASPSGSVSEGDKVTYTVTVKNTGTADFTTATPASFTDDLSKVTDDATYNDDASNGATVDGNTLSWSGALEAGDTVKVTYSVTVNTPDTGDRTLTNAVVPSDGGSCATTGDCTTTTFVPDIVTSKSVDPASGTTVTAGQVLTYTLTFTNKGTGTGPVDYVDDLTKVRDDATVTKDPSASNAALQATKVNKGYEITGALTAGQTVTVTYQVTVKADEQRGDDQLGNFLVKPGETPPTTCATDDPNCTANPVYSFVDWKTVDPASGTPVTPGQVLTYTLHFKNTGAAAGPIDKVDDLTQAIDDATVTKQPTVTGGNLEATPFGKDNRSHITGTLPVGATVTVTYQLTVKAAGQLGDGNAANFLLKPSDPPASSPDCKPASSQNPDCTVNRVGELKVSKIVDPNTGTVVHPGDTLHFTLSFENVGAGATKVDYVDDMTGVLDDATVTTQPVASSTALSLTPIRDGKIGISGTLDAGQKVTVTYAVTTKPFAQQGDHVMENYLDPVGTNPPARCVSTDPLCTRNPIAPPPVVPITPPGLAFTGTELVGPGIGLAVLLLALGGGLLVVRRRRQHGDEINNA